MRDVVTSPNVESRSKKIRLHRFLLFFAFSAMIAISWSLANPIFASPDEGQHMIRAEGMVRGQLASPYRVPSLPVGSENCFAFHTEISADCMELNWSTDLRSISTANDNYPPTFFAVAGLPTRIVKGETGAYAMRILCALLCSTFVALALSTMVDALDRNLAALVVVTALTPMVFFLSGMVNPSALAACAGLCFWCAVLFVPQNVNGRMTAVHLAGVSMTVLLSLRRDSVYWAVSIVAIAALICGVEGVCAFLRSRSGKLWMFICSVVGFLSYLGFGRGAGNSFVDNSGLASDLSENHNFTAVSWLTEYLRQHIGKFGMIDTNLPEPAYLLAYLVLGGTLIAALVFAPRRSSVILGLLFLCCLGIPVLIGFFRFPYFQSRYMLPLSIGLFPFAARSLQAVSLRALPRRLGVMASISFVVLQVVGLAQNQRRYSVGSTGTWWFPLRDVWDPPIGSSLFFITTCATGSIGLMLTLSHTWKN